jgi:hypothetical protein
VRQIDDRGRVKAFQGNIRVKRGQSKGDMAMMTLPANGTCGILSHRSPIESSFLHRGWSSLSGARAPRPKIGFLVFVGERPKSWKR